MISVMSVRTSYACPTCLALINESCACVARLHLASADRDVIEAVVDSLMCSNPFANRDASIEQEFSFAKPIAQ